MKNDALPIEGIDYVELYVGNAKQASYFTKTDSAFHRSPTADPETGVKDKTSYLMQQGDIRLLLTSSLIPDHPNLQVRNHTWRRRSRCCHASQRC